MSVIFKKNSRPGLKNFEGLGGATPRCACMLLIQMPHERLYNPNHEKGLMFYVVNSISRSIILKSTDNRRPTDCQ